MGNKIMGRNKKNIEPENNVEEKQVVNENPNAETPESVMNEYQEVKAEKKVRKKRVKKTVEPETNEAEENFAKMASVNLSIGLDIIISRVAPNQPLTDKEREAFNASAINLGRKYFQSFERWGEEINFVIAVAFIIVPRVNWDKFGKKNLFNIRKNGDGKVNTGERVDAERTEIISN